MSTTWYVSLYAQPDLNTCWRASLRMMLSYQGRRFSDSEWEKLCRSLLLQEFGGARPSLADFQIFQHGDGPRQVVDIERESGLILGLERHFREQKRDFKR